jgi:hypothetical protein
MKWLDDTPWRLECRPFVLHAILPRPSLDAGRRRGRPLMALLISTISGGITRLRDGLGRYDECPVTTAVNGGQIMTTTPAFVWKGAVVWWCVVMGMSGCVSVEPVPSSATYWEAKEVPDSQVLTDYNACKMWF